MKSVVIISLDNQDLHTDARVQRQIQYLSKEYEVHVVSYGQINSVLDLPAKSISIVGSLTRGIWKRRLNTLLLLPLGKLLGTGTYENWYWARPGHREAVRQINGLKPGVIHANDWWSLPVAVKAASTNGAKIVLDLHEYSPEEYSGSFWWKVFYKPVVEYILNQYLENVNRTVTVNQILADRYKKEFGIDPIVVMNTPPKARNITFHPVDQQRIRLVHHGYALQFRHIEKLVDIIARCDQRYSLSFILIGDKKYIEWLKKYANEVAPGRVSFLPGMKPADLVKKLEEFDVGISITQSESFNTWASLPNKFFEFISAGLAVCIGPSPAMAELVHKYRFGMVASTFEPNEVAEILNRLSTEEIEGMKRKALAARDFLNADVEMVKLLDLYKQL